MIETSDEVAVPDPAATVVVLRDGDDGPEVLLLQRHHALRSMPGMWVFPGGRVEPGDYLPGGDIYQAAIHAAIRETAEEAGLRIEPDQLLYMSHWTTPEGIKRRFSTWFFLAILGDDQEVVVDGGEIEFHRWVAPRVAFAEIADVQNPFRLMPPTFVSLTELAHYPSCAEARTGVATRETLLYAPQMVPIEGGLCFLYDGDAGYPTRCTDLEGPQHRTYLIDDQLEYIRRP